jgi:hypothetical protein
LWPKGSGEIGNPITISAYGTGARPVIDGNYAVAPVLTIKDQNYWMFDNLEIKNSIGLGLFVDGSPGTDVYGFTITNLYVHDGGLNDGQHLILIGQYENHSVHDVLIDNVEASNGWRGIEIGGKCCNNPAVRSTNIIIRNAKVHDVQSDGILVASTNNALIEQSVVYNTGIMTTKKGHTPNGLWTWDCDDCIVQFNEVYESHSPKGDGGAFDIDYYNHRNVVQYNYGHDNDAYCVAIYGGASDDVTTNNVIRYNICSNDGRKGWNPGIYITAKRGGSVQDTFFYNNTVYWNPVNMTGQYAIHITSMDDGLAVNNTNIYNNLIYSTSPNLVSIEADAEQQNLDNNLYWYIGADSPNFKQGDLYYDSLSAWQAGTGKDMHSIYADPQLNDPTYHEFGFPTTSFTLQDGSPAINAGADLVALGIVTSMGTQDFFGNPLPVGAYDIGAYEYPLFSVIPTDNGVSVTKTPTPLPQTSTPTGSIPTPTPVASYFVDCSAVTNGTGTQVSPWNNLDNINGRTFVAGEQILFQRGTTCTGQLWPKGSGVSGNPIIISTYGTGARPIIDGNNAASPVVTIKDQSYWTFDSLEIKNSTGLGLFIDGNPGTDVYGFTITNLYVHDGGLNDGQHLILIGQYKNHSVHDVLIDNVEASNGWRGIEIGGKCCNEPEIRSTDITIRNVNVHDVQSDGILMASTKNGLIEHSVVANSGMMTELQNHTPNGLWTWDCDDCMVQFNEVYESHSPSVDGGAFDIDYYNHRNIVQYNYAHDNDNYCVAVFGGNANDVTLDSVVRYNICSNDVRDGSQGAGAVVIFIWAGGGIRNTFIYNNTIYYNPANTAPAINIGSRGDRGIQDTYLYNNIVYSTCPNLVRIFSPPNQLSLDHNLYWYLGPGEPNFSLNSTTYTNFSAWQTGTGKDMHSIYADPLLNDPKYHEFGFPTTSFTLQDESPAINAGVDLAALGIVTSMGMQDFFGNPLPVGAYDIGAYEHP